MKAPCKSQAAPFGAADASVQHRQAVAVASATLGAAEALFVNNASLVEIAFVNSEAPP